MNSAIESSSEGVSLLIEPAVPMSGTSRSCNLRAGSRARTTLLNLSTYHNVDRCFQQDPRGRTRLLVSEASANYSERSRRIRWSTDPMLLVDQSCQGVRG